MISKRASSTVEAAMVIPLVILIIAAIISKGIDLEAALDTQAASHIITQSAIQTEDILRGVWALK